MRNKKIETHIAKGVSKGLFKDTLNAGTIADILSKETLYAEDIECLRLLAKCSLEKGKVTAQICIIVDCALLLAAFVLPLGILFPALLIVEIPIVLFCFYTLIRSIQYLLTCQTDNEMMAWSIGNYPLLLLKYIDEVLC